MATVNLSDEEPSSEQGPDGDKAGVSQPESNPAEQLTEESPPQLPVPGAEQTPSKEQQSEESEPQ